MNQLHPFQSSSFELLAVLVPVEKDDLRFTKTHKNVGGRYYFGWNDGGYILPEGDWIILGEITRDESGRPELVITAHGAFILGTPYIINEIESQTGLLWKNPVPQPECQGEYGPDETWIREYEEAESRVIPADMKVVILNKEK